MATQSLEKKRKILTLTITEFCNLDCVYCYERKKSSRVMPLSIAKAAVQNAAGISSEFDEIEVHLFGGEPTLRKKFIIDLVDWTEKQKFPKSVVFFLETNGTLITPKFAKWLSSRRDLVRAGLSLDGTRETHNRNRTNSYDQIDISFFRETFPEQAARMTIHTDTVGSLADDIIHVHRLGFQNIDVVFALGLAWDSSDLEETILRELHKLCDFYLENREVEKCSLLDINLIELMRPRDSVPKWCGCGASMVSISVDGDTYPCHVFQPNTQSSPASSLTYDFPANANYADPACKTCLLESACPNCYGMNIVDGRGVVERDRRQCGIMKARVKAVVYLRAKEIALGRYADDPIRTFFDIEAIEALRPALEACADGPIQNGRV